MKHVLWSEVITHESEVATFLTKNNFKPGTFYLVKETGVFGRNTGYVRVIYIAKETK